MSKEEVRGIPKLKFEKGKTCGEGKIGKQTKMSLPQLHHQITSKRLETRHMESMEPVQVDNVGRNIFVNVIANDFS